MAKPTLTIDIDVTPKPAIIVGGFYRAANAFTSFKDPIEQAIKEVILPSINNNFESEGIPPWEPLTDATYARRENPGMPILQQTGRLKNVATSIKPWTINNNEAFLLSNNLGEAFYGAIHESGARFMPARPWSTISTLDEEKIEQVFAAHTIGRILKYATVTTIIGGAITAGLGGFGKAIKVLTGGR
jgi:phage gpG-like protein